MYQLDEDNINEVWVHFDLDAFYASVEALYSPDINLIPIGIGNKQMLSTCNYEARKYGIKAGMPGFKALKLCPNLKIIKNDIKKYEFHSIKVMNILKLFDKNIEIYGLDEAYILIKKDNFKIIKNFFNIKKELKYEIKNIEILGNKIRLLIFEKTQLTISAGISITKGLSKLCTSENKPNGQFILIKNIKEFIKNKSIRKLNGIGKKISEILKETLNIKTIGDLKEKMYLIYLVFPKKTFILLMKLSYGFSNFDIKRKKEKNNSISISNSFKSTNDFEIILTKIFLISKTLSKKLKNKTANSIHLFIRYKDYNSINKQIKLLKPINSEFDIFENVINILKIFYPKINNINNNFINNISIKLFNIQIKNNLFYFIKSKNNILPKKYYKCPICGINLIPYSELLVNSHVNDCLDRKELNKEGSKKINNLLNYFIKK